jgi:hypothetical protein
MKNEGIARDDEKYYERNEGITCTPMTILKYAMRVLHTHQ